MEQPPRDMVALGILLADVASGQVQLGIMLPQGYTNMVKDAFNLADEFLKQAGEKS